jgi:hypothetical protein
VLGTHNYGTGTLKLSSVGGLATTKDLVWAKAASQQQRFGGGGLATTKDLVSAEAPSQQQMTSFWRRRPRNNEWPRFGRGGAGVLTQGAAAPSSPGPDTDVQNSRATLKISLKPAKDLFNSHGTFLQFLPELHLQKKYAYLQHCFHGFLTNQQKRSFGIELNGFVNHELGVVKLIHSKRRST